MAQIRVNGSVSDPFDIQNATIQGCPLSLLLYLLVMEHLMQAIRGSAEVQGVKIGDKQFKCLTFADDFLLYISNPHTSLP